MPGVLFNKWAFRVALAVNVGVSVSFLALGLIAMRQGLLWRADFTAFYTGGALVRDGLGQQLYDYELQALYQKELLGENSFNEGLLPFNYPPHAALLFAPLTLFSRPVAFGLWTVIQFGLLTWLLAILWQFSVNWSRTERVLLLTGVLGFLPLLTNILLGAFSLLALNCLLAWAINLKQRKDAPAGLWLAVAAFKPQTVALPGLVTLFARRWRAILTMAAGGVIMMLIGAILLGPRIWWEFLRVLQLSASFFNEYGIYPATMYNLKGTLVLWLGNEQKALINTLSLIGFLVSIGITGWLWRSKWEPDRPDFELRMALTLTLSVLFGLHVNPQDGLLLVAPAILFYDYLRQRNLPRKAYGIFLWLCPLIFLFSEFTVREKLGIRLPVVAIVVLLGWQMKVGYDQA